LGGEVVAALVELHHPQGLVRLHGFVGDLGDERDVLAGGEARNQVVELEHETHVATTICGERGFVGARQIGVLVYDLAASRQIETADDVQERRLSGSGRPEQDDELSSVERQAYLTQCMNLDISHPVNLGEISNVEERSRHHLKLLSTGRLTNGGQWPRPPRPSS
jgi:hypothetical protein